ncbi:MAG: hypothetical protein JXJ04_02235 [Spirochaetales bacterium]|nr:hypothetical protein [Spirochaetales bacterium]
MSRLLILLITLTFLFLFSCTMDEDLIGTWAQEASWDVPDEGTYKGRVEFIFEEDTLEVLFYGQADDWVLMPNGSLRADYTVAGNIISIEMTEMLMDDVWTEYTETGTAQYEISGDTMDLIIDFTGDGIYDDSQPFSTTFPGGEGPQSDILYELTKE